MIRDLSNTKIQVTPQQSEMVQKWAFLQGWRWSKSKDNVSNLGHPSLYFEETKYILYCGDDDYDGYYECREITLDELLGFPQFYAVKCPADYETNRVWKRYVGKLNEVAGGECWLGHLVGQFFGFDGGKYNNGTTWRESITKFSNPVTELSLEEVEIMLWWEGSKKKVGPTESEKSPGEPMPEPTAPFLTPHEEWIHLRIADLSNYLTYHIGCRKPINVDVVEEYNQLIQK